jgi:hypothetical protein
MATVMPARGHSTAPKFSPDQPRELKRFFKELEYHFTACSITDAAEKKGYAVRYVDFDVADLWEGLAEFSTGGYDGFKTAVHELYPGAGEDRKWTMADMDKLVGEQLRIGIFSIADFGNYHRSFIQITKYLVDKGRLSEQGQSRAFIRGIQPTLWERIHRRLEIKKPDVHPDDPYDLKDIIKAAEHVLYDPNIATYVRPPSTTPPTNASTSVAASTAVKQEDLASTLQVFVQALEKTFERVLTAQPQSANRPPAPRTNAPGTLDPSCFMCSEIGHGAKECEVTKEMIRLGKCIINNEGKIVLPNGHYIPRAITGKNLRERINEWHSRNPGTSPTPSSSMMYSVSDAQNAPSTVFLGGASPTDVQLTQAEQILLLERQIMALRSGKKFDGVEILRRPQKPKNPLPVVSVDSLPDPAPAPSASNSHSQPQSTVESNVTNPPASTSTDQPTAEKSTQAPTETSRIDKSPQAPRVDNITNAPTHPFASKRPNYLPPQEKNFATPQKSDPAYKTTAPIQNAKTIEEVYNRSMAAPCVTLSPNELLSISSEVRQKVREAVTPKRQTNTDTATANMSEVHSVLPFTTAEDVDEPSILPNTQDPPADAIVIPDFYETYLSRLAPGETPEVLTVAKESHSLRSINVKVNGQDEVESILDPGCMIIAMSEATCHAMGVIYDPSIVIHMESANGEKDPTLGLARNVPCRIGEIILYLQFHIVRSPAYDVLLGRPFDVLTESLVKNYANEDQTITICDPNFQRQITVPTFRRGPPRYTTVTRSRQDFRISRQ